MEMYIPFCIACHHLIPSMIPDLRIFFFINTFQLVSMTINWSHLCEKGKTISFSELLMTDLGPHDHKINFRKSGKS